MFRLIAVAALLGALVLVGLYHVTRGRSARSVEGALSLWDRLAYAVCLGSVALAGVTAFYAGVCQNQELSGWLLMLHMCGAAGFLGGMFLIAFLWSEACRFQKQDCCCASVRDEAAKCESKPSRFSCGQKFWFWAIRVLGLTTAIMPLVSMLPLFDSTGLKTLSSLHHYCSVALVVAVIAHGYLMLTVKRTSRV